MNYTSILSHFNITELNQMQKATLEAIPKPNDVTRLMTSLFVKMQYYKYTGDMKSGLVWIVKGQKEVGLQMVRRSNGI